MTSPNGRIGSVASAHGARTLIVLKGFIGGPSKDTPGAQGTIGVGVARLSFHFGRGLPAFYRGLGDPVASSIEHMSAQLLESSSAVSRSG